jgi:5-hydroxyisourate hydrolase
MSAITTHVLDISSGRPAAGVDVVLEFRGSGEDWAELGRGKTDADGRLRTLLAVGAPLVEGFYRLVFFTRAYFEQAGLSSFHPHVIIEFEVLTSEPHYHVPLLVSPFGYTTYRGS